MSRSVESKREPSGKAKWIKPVIIDMDDSAENVEGSNGIITDGGGRSTS